MPITNMAFVPPTGLNDATYSPQTPVSEAAIRSQIQGVSDQLATYINNTTNPTMQTALDSSSTAVSTSNTANSSANNAVSTANTANANAVNAVNTANTALTNSSNAVTTSNTANTTANSANTTAVAVQADYTVQKPIMLQAVTDVNLKVDKSYVDAAVASFALGAIPPKGIVSSMFSDAINAELANIAVNTTNITANSINLTSLINHPVYSVDTGISNAYVVTLNPIPISYIDGMGIIVKIGTASTAPSTLNVNNLGAIPLMSSTGNALTGLKANSIYSFRYNSSTAVFQSLSEGVDASNLITNVNNILNM